METWAQQFPHLYAPSHWAEGGVDLQFGTEQPPDELIGKAHVVGRTEGGIVVCQNDRGWRFLPGGTREPDETIEHLVRREVREEAGARVTGPLIWLGGHRAHQRRPEPYRPHLPHPVSYWANYVVDVTVDGNPSNPDDAEQVIEVLVLPPDEAITYLDARDDNNGVMAGLVRLAQAMGLV
ncbi:NUDIX domain-containing protein [Streptomyces sp. SID13031]|uniref:NUDIX domain-containing protein n=1 Tax=Streptomyces sp. SID13031 TaxID=2706046 RepID=UPI0013C8903F|nr:NUDIX domain-containing protein [Streptomyces sp. SID13031]NEA36390.1 NUDIX domain-containing protein [Streptomyces sp. SID13031]